MLYGGAKAVIAVVYQSSALAFRSVAPRWRLLMAVFTSGFHFFIILECFHHFIEGSLHPRRHRDRLRLFTTKVIATTCEGIEKAAVVGVVPAL